jgi:hypothetical protein
MTKLYVTYGSGTHQADNFSVIEGATEDDCREQLEAINGKYAFSYSSGYFVGHAEKYGLTQIPLQAHVYTKEEA